LADEAGTRTRRRRCTALTLAAFALLAPSTASADRLRTIDVATGAATVVSSSPNLEWLDAPCWAPDGRLVALEYKSTRRALLRRYVAYGPTGTREVLDRASRFTTHAALAPGCARVAERRRRMPLGGRGVVVRDLGGPPLAELALERPRSAALLGWSPDGARLAAGRGMPEGGIEVVTFDLATGALRLLNGGGSADALGWSAQGDRIAIFMEDELRVFDVEGNLQVAAAPGARADGGLAWSPDGTQIAFSARRGTGVSHYVVAVQEGAAPRLLFATPSPSSTPLAWSPDGTRLAVGGG
jgi:WD40 repeat protein